MRKLITLAAAVALGLTGCATAAETEPTPTDVPQSAPAADTTEPTTPAGESGGVSPRGHQLIAIGEPATLYDRDLPVGTITVVSIEPTDPALQSPDAEHSLIVNLEVETTTDLTSPLTLKWDAVDAEGVTINDVFVQLGSDAIESGDAWPSWEGVGPGEKVRGALEIGLSAEPAALILQWTINYDTGQYGYEITL